MGETIFSYIPAPDYGEALSTNHPTSPINLISTNVNGFSLMTTLISDADNSGHPSTTQFSINTVPSSMTTTDSMTTGEQTGLNSSSFSPTATLTHSTLPTTESFSQASALKSSNFPANFDTKANSSQGIAMTPGFSSMVINYALVAVASFGILLSMTFVLTVAVGRHSRLKHFNLDPRNVLVNIRLTRAVLDVVTLAGFILYAMLPNLTIVGLLILCSGLTLVYGSDMTYQWHLLRALEYKDSADFAFATFVSVAVGCIWTIGLSTQLRHDASWFPQDPFTYVWVAWLMLTVVISAGVAIKTIVCLQCINEDIGKDHQMPGVPSLTPEEIKKRRRLIVARLATMPLLNFLIIALLFVRVWVKSQVLILVALVLYLGHGLISFLEPTLVYQNRIVD